MMDYQLMDLNFFTNLEYFRYVEVTCNVICSSKVISTVYRKKGYLYFVFS